MVRKLCVLAVVLGFASVADAACGRLGLFGRVRERVAERRQGFVEGRRASWGGAGCSGMTAAGCSGYAVPMGCSGFANPAPFSGPIPQPMPAHPAGPVVPLKR
jgi:hypothetical protein